MIPVYKPYFPDGALRYAHDALDSTWVSSKGIYLQKVRDVLSALWNTDYIILTNSGTSANHLMAIATKAKYPKRSLVIAPNNVYVAAWNPFLFEDYTLEYHDANIETWNMDMGGIKYDNNSILLVVPNLGNIINVPDILAENPNAIILEDNCEGFGGKYNGFPSGTSSEAFTLSFFGNKNITSGEGGAFVTYDKDMYEEAFLYWGQGMSSNSNVRFVHNSIGHNYRMTNVEAGILLGQLELADEILELKEKVFYNYASEFFDLEGVYLQVPEKGTEHSNWMFGIRVDGSDFQSAKQFFSRSGIEVRPMFYPVTSHGHLKEVQCDVKVATKLAQECIVLPSYPEVTKEDQEYIIERVKAYVRQLKIL